MSQEQRNTQSGAHPNPDSGEYQRMSVEGRMSQPMAQNLKMATFAPSASMADADLSELLAQRQEAEAPRDPYIGATIDGRYKVERILGEGGMGVVYSCRHTIIGKKVAMKVLRADMARDAEVTERFLNEAKAASAIGSAHIIDISDFGRLPDGSTYFVMEFLEGKPLSGVIEEGKGMPVARILKIAAQLADGLAGAHNADIVHRDLKPDNIFLITRGKETDFVKILDFGIAKVSTGTGAKLTRAGAVFGTPHYMSPEQAAGAPVDHRGDIYSFGVILYEMASGKVPFDADNFMGILTQHMYKAPVPIRAIVPEPQDVPPGLEAVILKCLSKRPEQRYQSMEQLRDELIKLQDGLVPDAVPEMMSRSGGFNVPADYFKKPAAAMAAPVAAHPAGVPRRSSFPIVAIVASAATVLLVGGVIAATVIVTSAKAPEKPVAEKPAEKPADKPAEKPADTAAATPSVAVAPSKPEKKVMLIVDPAGAELKVGDKSLGEAPRVIQVPEGEKVSVTVSKDGYESKTIELDGQNDREKLSLTRKPASSAPPTSKAKTPPPPEPAKTTTPPATKTKPPTGTDPGLVNPWG